MSGTTADLLVLITFAILSICTVLTFTKMLPNALRTHQIGTFRVIYENFFSFTIFFRLVSFKYGTTFMLLPHILVASFQNRAISRLDRELHDQITSEVRTQFFDPRSLNLNYK
jgi:hypothetical protein